MLKFCSIETALRERQISSFILICWFIDSEVDLAIYKYAFQGGGGGGGAGEATRSGTEKRCSHNLQSGQSTG